MMKPSLLVLVLGAVALGGCSWEPIAPENGAPVTVSTAPATAPTATIPSPTQHTRRGDEAATMAERMIGTPYRWGGADVDGFDCSGLVQFAFAQARLVVPRTTSQQRQFIQPVSRRALRRGDLVFFDIEGKDNHVGLYLGNNQFVHAPSRGKRVQAVSLDQTYYAQRFSGAGRVPGADAPLN